MEETGGYEFEPASGQIAKEFQCIICQYILKATTNLPCGHGYCSTCLNKWEEERLERELELQCSICNKTYSRDKVQSNILIDRFITTSLDVKCCYHDDGCDWIGKIVDYEVHKENHCQYTRLKCTNAGCDDMVRKCYLDDHIKRGCIFRKVQCQACQEVQVYHNLENHFQQCAFYQIKCPNEGCEQVIERNQMTNHLQKDCEFHLVSCGYAIVGCKEKFLRQEAEDHAKINTNYHMSLVLRNSLVEVAKTKRQLKIATDRLAIVETEWQTSKENEKALKLQVDTLNEQCSAIGESFAQARQEIDQLKEQQGTMEASTGNFVEKQGLMEKTLVNTTNDTKASVELLSTFLLDGGSAKQQEALPKRNIRDWCFLLHEQNYLSYREKQVQTSQLGYNLPRLNELRDLMNNEERIPVEYGQRFQEMFQKMEELKFYRGCTPNKLLMKSPMHGRTLGIAFLSDWALSERKKSANCSYKSDESCVLTFSAGSNLFLCKEGWGNGNAKVELQHPLKEEKIGDNMWGRRDWCFSGVVENDMLVDNKYILVVLTKIE